MNVQKHAYILTHRMGKKSILPIFTLLKPIETWCTGSQRDFWVFVVGFFGRFDPGFNNYFYSPAQTLQKTHKKPNPHHTENPQQKPKNRVGSQCNKYQPFYVKNLHFC